MTVCATPSYCLISFTSHLRQSWLGTMHPNRKRTHLVNNGVTRRQGRRRNQQEKPFRLIHVLRVRTPHIACPSLTVNTGQNIVEVWPIPDFALCLRSLHTFVFEPPRHHAVLDAFSVIEISLLDTGEDFLFSSCVVRGCSIEATLVYFTRSDTPQAQKLSAVRTFLYCLHVPDPSRTRGCLARKLKFYRRQCRSFLLDTNSGQRPHDLQFVVSYCFIKWEHAWFETLLRHRRASNPHRYSEAWKPYQYDNYWHYSSTTDKIDSRVQWRICRTSQSAFSDGERGQLNPT